MDRKLEEVEFVIFDTETTGLDPASGDRIVEIAAVRFRSGKSLGSFHSLVNPGRPVSARAFEVNHISDEMLKTAPRMEEVLPAFLDFIRDSCLCSYNIPFDLGFINNELKLAGLAPLEQAALVDILTMSRKLLPRLERHALWFVAKSLGIENRQEHRAFSDVEMAWEVFRQLRAMVGEKGVNDYKGFLTLFGTSPRILDSFQERKIARIEEAIEQGLKVKVKYFTRSSAEISERELTPKEIKFDPAGVYLVGFCSLRNEERTFRIDNILELEII